MKQPQCPFCKSRDIEGSNPLFNGRPLSLKEPKGGDPAEWPAGMRVREFPNVE